MDRHDLDRLEKRFDELLPGLLASGHLREWAVISDSGLVGVEREFGHAYQLGRKTLGELPFIVQQVQPRGYVAKITRLGWT